MKTYNELGHVALGTALLSLAAQVSQDATKVYKTLNFDIYPKWFPVFYVLASKGSDSVVNIAKEIKQSQVSVSKIIERAKLLGAKRLYLESNTILKPAVNLYHKLGFEHIKGATSPYERCNVQMEIFLNRAAQLER